MRNKKLESAFLALMERDKAMGRIGTITRVRSSLQCLDKAVDLLEALCGPDEERSVVMGLPDGCFNEDAMLSFVREQTARGMAFVEELYDVLATNGACPRLSPWKPPVSEEALARIVHEAFRLPVERGQTLAQSEGRGYRFVEWEDLAPEARAGKRQAARALLERFRIVFKDAHDACDGRSNNG